MAKGRAGPRLFELEPFTGICRSFERGWEPLSPMRAHMALTTWLDAVSELRSLGPGCQGETLLNRFDGQLSVLRGALLGDILRLITPWQLERKPEGLRKASPSALVVQQNGPNACWVLHLRRHYSVSS